jgi:hypothetical protein
LVESLAGDCAVAAKVASLLLNRPGQVFEEGEFRSAGVSAAETGAMIRSLRDFRRRGWCARVGGGWQAVPAKLPPAIPSFLEGAAAMWRDIGPPVRAEAVVTMPPGTSRLAEVLPTLGLAHVGMAETRETFGRVARGARQTLTIASPFLNDEGLSWALGLFAETAAPERNLIVRALGVTRAVLLARKGETDALGVRVFDYAVPTPEGDSYETFHAKVVLADEAVAYVGSANMLVQGRQPMELGVVLEGGPVPEVAALMRAIQKIAGRMHEGKLEVTQFAGST